MASGTRRDPTKGFGVSEGLEWKISMVKKASAREVERGRVKVSFQTGLVDPCSSGRVERRRLGSRKTAA